MPRVTKNAFSRFVSTGCERQLRLYLATDEERGAQDMPDEQDPRPGLEYVTQQGEDWQHEKVLDLGVTFGVERLISEPRETDVGRTVYEAIQLSDKLPSAAELLNRGLEVGWLVEAEFTFGEAFKQAIGFADLETTFEDVSYAALRPDLIEVATPGTFEESFSPDGQLSKISGDDTRTQLRVIDVKLTSEPSANYFAEVVLYSMALAGWLIDRGLDDEFVVAGDAALWAGSHDASVLVQTQAKAQEEARTPTVPELREALKSDLELAFPEVFSPRVRKFFQHDLPSVLARDWRELDWHVDNKCKSCGFIGAPWIRNGQPTADANRRHCIQHAEDVQHLSQVADVTTGARKTFEVVGIEEVATLAGTDPQHAVFSDHHVLRGSREVITRRAESLGNQESILVPNSGTSATMPGFANLKIEMSVDFEISSAITVAFGVKSAFFNSATRDLSTRGPEPFAVASKSFEAEFQALRGFLEFIHARLSEARQAYPDARVQLYVWDRLELKHLSRVVGRYLDRLIDETALQDLAWLFPSEELVPNAQYATRNSPITVIRDIVRSHVAAPIPHYYSLLETARVYHREGLPDHVAEFDVHPLFADPLSDQIPSERAHEIWAQSTNPPWLQQAERLSRTVRTRLVALESVRRRLEADLTGQLLARAPKIRVGALAPSGGMAIDSELQLAYAKLDAAVGSLEIDQIRAMSPTEREAKFRSARLSERLQEQEERDYLESIGVADRENVRVFRIPETSREFRARDGDIGFAVSSEDHAGLLDESLKKIVDGTALDVPGLHRGMKMSKAVEVSVLKIDREADLIVVKFSNYLGGVQLGIADFIQRLEAEADVNLTNNLMLDPVHIDFFTGRLETALKAIGNPPSAVSDPQVVRAIGDPRTRGPRQTDDVPAADFIWKAGETSGVEIAQDLTNAKIYLEGRGADLNESQWAAWDAAFKRRLQTIWGPPGTGKSKTLRSIILGAVHQALENDRQLRLLVCAPTYNALDNILEGIVDEVAELLGDDTFVRRLRSSTRQQPEWTVDSDIDLVVSSDPERAEELREYLSGATGIAIVGAVPQQVSALLKSAGTGIAPFFDFLVFDEASQIDVGNAMLALCSVAENAQLVVAGDPLQMPPIHKAEPPLGLEALVGSIYEYYEQVHGVVSKQLLCNYRSNEEIVDFARRSDYPQNLESFRPELRLRMSNPPVERPNDWPPGIVWSPELEALAGAEPVASAFVYDDENWSSQWNHFEAQIVAGVVVSVRRRMLHDLAGDLDKNGHPIEPSDHLIDDEAFWSRAVGVVTPHRAQQALVIGHLVRAFPDAPERLIRSAVDTVERFQGQERDMIIVSYALGDPDAVREEDEFLMGAKRFNVAASRAKAKLLVLASEQVAEHLSHEVDVMRDSKLLKLYLEGYCSEHEPLALPYVSVGGEIRSMDGSHRWRT